MIFIATRNFEVGLNPIVVKTFSIVVTIPSLAKTQAVFAAKIFKISFLVCKLLTVPCESFNNQHNREN